LTAAEIPGREWSNGAGAEGAGTKFDSRVVEAVLMLPDDA
jgi:hypothetical protein